MRTNLRDIALSIASFSPCTLFVFVFVRICIQIGVNFSYLVHRAAAFAGGLIPQILYLKVTEIFQGRPANFYQALLKCNFDNIQSILLFKIAIVK